MQITANSKKAIVMYILILVLPLISSGLGLIGRWLGRSGSAVLSTWLLFITWGLAIYVYFEVCLCANIVNIKLYTWLLIGIYQLNIGLLFDQVSSTMIVVVTTISMLVHLYSTAYMSHDPHLTRFMSHLSLFTFHMLVLVTADNFFQLFIGWEGVGLCSYLLINFWFTRLMANKAALKAMIMNRVADIFFMFAIVLLLETFKTTNFTIIFTLLPFFVTDAYSLLGCTVSTINVIAFFLFIGAIGKSAQLGLHTWLPDAMEGPTPVSALLHAATMVTAGVFLSIRCSAIFESSEIVLTLSILFGGSTAVFAGLIAIFQYDIKKVIAYSTCSQSGYMFFSCGLSNYYIAFFHLWNHAFFKALLFLGAGAVIHAFFDEQDMRHLGRFKIVLPFTYYCFWIGSLAIMGFPFLTGFYSKDLILESAYSRFIINATFIYTLGLLAAICTAIYSMRLVFLVFLERHDMAGFWIQFKYPNDIPEAPWQMYIGMCILAFCSLPAGYLFSDLWLELDKFFELIQSIYRPAIFLQWMQNLFIL
jgi:NADH-quinone oxidoreductase subunit L